MFDSTLTIIVLSYYHEKYIGRAIETILKQKTTIDYNILVADDCSRDGTVNIVKRYKEMCPDKVFLKENLQNVGICKNLYDSLMLCKSKYIMITDGDDCWIDDSKIEQQFQFLETHSFLFGVSTLNEPRYFDGERAGEVYPNKLYWDRIITREDFLNGACFSTVGMMFKNIFMEEKAQKQFSLMCDFSRDLDDLTFATFLFDYGNVYTLPILGYSTTVRREDDTNEHNYNTKYKVTERIRNEVEVLNRIEEYYSDGISFKKRYRKCAKTLISQIIKYRNLTAIDVLSRIPLKHLIM